MGAGNETKQQNLKGETTERYIVCPSAFCFPGLIKSAVSAPQPFRLRHYQFADYKFFLRSRNWQTEFPQDVPSFTCGRPLRFMRRGTEGPYTSASSSPTRRPHRCARATARLTAQESSTYILFLGLGLGSVQNSAIVDAVFENLKSNF